MLQQSGKLEWQVKKIQKQAEERDAQRRAKALEVNYIDLSEAPIQVDALKNLSEETARALEIATFQAKNNVLALAAYDPKDQKVEGIVNILRKNFDRIEIFLVSKSSLEHVWTYYKFIPKATGQITGKIDIESGRISELLNKLTTIEAINKEILEFDLQKYSLGQLLEVILAGALKNRASDIHTEAGEKTARLRYRIDGALYDIAFIDNRIYNFLLNRTKLLSGLKINVHDVPQDGRFTIGLTNKEIELRVSMVPSEYGETVVMRILDPDAINLKLEDLGLRPDDSPIIQEQLKEPNGIIFNTGPTGSGKSTTLYTFLKHIYNPELKIITIEDPIEYRLAGIQQTQVDPEAGYDFATGLRSLMRQDPDIILVGEVRDKETAEIAIQAALTGHLVLSTVHANSATAAIPRLLDLGVKAISIAPALNLIIAQRLVRKLCDECKKEIQITDELKNKIENFLARMPKKINKDDYKNYKIYEASAGCQKCNNIGYKGRIAIFELLIVTDEYEELIAKGAGEIQISKKAVADGMTTFQEDGILKMLKGVTSFAEVESITGPLKSL